MQMHDNYEEKAKRRKEKIEQMKREKERQLLIRKLVIPVALVFVLCVCAGIWAIKLAVGKHRAENPADAKLPDAGFESADKAQESENSVPKSDEFAFSSDMTLASADIMAVFSNIEEDRIKFIEEKGFNTLGGGSLEPVLTAQADEGTIWDVEDAVSENFIVIDVENKRILAQKEAKARISPASMTKMLTVLVAAEHITDADIDDTFEITQEITDYSFSNDCSAAGFKAGERVTIKDLFYGTVLPSGADAALGLAIYAAGSHEAFVELMNEKLAELGLSETSRFTNCVGLYDENHYSTVYDMAVIMKAAYDNKFCREVLSAHIYTTSQTDEHPDGIELSNLFLRRIEDRDTHGEVICAKTGYVQQSGNCAASLSIGNDGKLYICATARSKSAWQCIKDHVTLYQHFL